MLAAGRGSGSWQQTRSRVLSKQQKLKILRQNDSKRTGKPPVLCCEHRRRCHHCVSLQACPDLVAVAWQQAGQNCSSPKEGTWLLGDASSALPWLGGPARLCWELGRNATACVGAGVATGGCQALGVQRCGRFWVLMMAGFEDEQAAGDAAPLVKTSPIIFPAFQLFLAFQECLNSGEKAGDKSVSLCAVTRLQ